MDTLDEAVRYQEALVSDLEDRCNVLEIKEDGKRVGWLKNVVARFNNGESLEPLLLHLRMKWLISVSLRDFASCGCRWSRGSTRS